MSKKPLVVFDIETTGLDKAKDHIIQFAAIKVVDGEIVDEINEYIQPQGNYTMGLGAYIKHRIHPNFLKDKPYMFDVAGKIVDFIGDCDVLTYNGNSFDIPFLKRELLAAGFDIDFTKHDCYDAFLEEKRRNGITLEDTFVRYFHNTMIDEGLAAHDAFSDIKATYRIFDAQQKNKEYGPETLLGEDGFLSEMEFNGEMVPCFSVGKYRGISIAYVAKIDNGYIEWCLSPRGGFTQSTKNIIKKYANT